MTDRGRVLRVRFTRISPTHHRFEWGAGPQLAVRELETRSTLLHDLVHFAVETEARLRDSFFGGLARGDSYEALMGELPPGATGEIATTERVVGALQGAWKHGLDPARFVATFRDYQAQLGEPMPAWLTAQLFVRVAQRLHELEGAWRGTPFRQALELSFPMEVDG